MIQPAFVRKLMLAPLPDSPGVARHLSAASGMAVIGVHLYVVADDELHLGVFDLECRETGTLIRLFPGELPNDPVTRKKEKPDLEALVRLPPCGACPHGALLALPSGSRPNRRTGVVLSLDVAGRVKGDPIPIDFSAVYGALDEHLPQLNIEGALALGPELVLLHRGSKSHPTGALIAFALQDFLARLSVEPVEPPPLLAARIDRIDLGTIEGAVLSFTDGATLPDGRIVFSAVAENAEDTYQDGPCMGAAIGIIGTDGQIEALHRLEPTQKVEGVHATIHGDLIHLLLVTDADDPGVAGTLLSAEMPLHSMIQASQG